MTQHHPPKLYADALPIAPPDFGPLMRALQQAAREVVKLMPVIVRGAARAVAGIRKINVSLEPVVREAAAAGVDRHTLLTEPERAAARIEVYVSGCEATYYVRGGMHPAYWSNPAALDVLVRRTLQGRPEDPDDPAVDLTPHNRARLAVAAIRGWVHANEAA